MQHIPKQSHYVRCPALELLCDGLCGPVAKKFGNPRFTPTTKRRCYIDLTCDDSLKISLIQEIRQIFDFH